MEKSAFHNKIQNPYNYTLQEKLEIQAEKTRHPYCAILQQFDLMSDKAANIYQWEKRFVPKVALYMLDTPKLLGQLQDVNIIDISSPEDLALKQQIETTKSREYTSNETETFDVMREINSYQEVSLKTAPRSVILAKFLEAGNCQTEDDDKNSLSSIDDLGKKSIASDNSLDTETMAVIFEKQGKYDKAIGVYEKLMSKYPEKSSTFANRMVELKSKLENK